MLPGLGYRLGIIPTRDWWWEWTSAIASASFPLGT